MKAKQPYGPPMTLANMRELGVHNLIAYRLNDSCPHTALIDVSSYPARLRCRGRGPTILIRGYENSGLEVYGGHSIGRMATGRLVARTALCTIGSEQLLAYSMISPSAK